MPNVLSMMPFIHFPVVPALPDEDDGRGELLKELPAPLFVSEEGLEIESPCLRLFNMSTTGVIPRDE